MKAKNINEAWEIANAFYPDGLLKDHTSTEKAGYKVYREIGKYYNYVCDLGDRLELNFEDGRTLNVWIEYEEQASGVSEEQMLDYLQSALSSFKEEEARYVINDRIVSKRLDSLLACAAMVESLIGKPINLQLSGTVSIGF